MDEVVGFREHFLVESFLREDTALDLLPLRGGRLPEEIPDETAILVRRGAHGPPSVTALP
jgi:hypothetical protein